MPERNASYFLIRVTKALVRGLRSIQPDVTDEEIRAAVMESVGTTINRHELTDRLIGRAIDEALAEGPAEDPRIPHGLLELAGEDDEDRELTPRLNALLDPAEWWKVPRGPGDPGNLGD